MSFIYNNAVAGASGAQTTLQLISRSLRFNSADSAYLSRTPASAGNRKTWTYSLWVKRSALGVEQHIFSAGVPAVADDGLNFDSSDRLSGYTFRGSLTSSLVTTQVFRDCSAWYHFLWAWDTDNATTALRSRLYVNGVEITAFSTSSYPASGTSSDINSNVDHSIGDNRPNFTTGNFSGYLADIHFIDGQALTPSSFAETNATTGQWVPKVYTGSYGTNGFRLDFSDNSAATAAALGKDTSGNGNNFTPNNFIVSNAYTVLPTPSVAPTDPSGAWDGNPSTYAYGPSATTWTFSTPISLPAARFDLHARSGWTWTASTNLGTVTLTSNGTWPGSPGSYPGWYSYANAGLTTVYSISVSAGANWTLQGMQIAGNPSVVGTQLLAFGSQNSSDSLVDTPTSYGTDTGVGGEVRGNYCTWNPLANSAAQLTYSNGNLDIAQSNAASYALPIGTIGVSSGKWYWETIITSAGTCRTGVVRDGSSLSTYLGSAATAYAYASGGYKSNNNSNSSTGYSTYTNGDIIGIALDLDNGAIYFSKNGTWQQSGNPVTQTNPAYTGLSGTYFASWGKDDYVATSCSINFGQRPFAYTAPSGFKALCDTNLPAPVVAKPSTVMDVKLYTGNGSTQTISGLGFSPDLVWIKSRSAAYNNRLYDQVRGVENVLNSNTTAAEGSDGTGLTAFTSSGFTLGSSLAQNENNSTFVAWTWDAGSSTVTNTQGSITSQVRANTSAGFSIVTFTAPASGVYSFGHGLGVAPRMVIMKDRGSGGTLWCVYHASVTSNDQALALNQTAAISSYPGIWGAGVTSTVVGSTANMGIVPSSPAVAYCFAPVAGYSSFGSYTGNGSTDGPFVYLGFRPRWILFKNSSVGVENWWLHDTARNTYNVMTSLLLPDSAGAEATNTAHSVDALSNGFKIRTNAQGVNGVHTIVYAAFAENPFQYARAR